MKRHGRMGWVAAVLLLIGSVGNAAQVLGPWEMKSGVTPAPTHAQGGAALDGMIYAIGGQAPGPYGSNVVQKYDPETDTWTYVAPMPTARHSLDAVALDGQIYAIGGHVTNSRSENQRYDPGTDTWTALASKPTAVSGLGAAAFGGKIYTFGGNRYGSMQSVIEVYDPATNSWQNVGNMPQAGEPWDAAVLGDKIYLAGGNGFGGGTSDHLWSYEPSTGTWDTSLPAMSSVRAYPVLVSAGNTLYAIGGHDGTNYLNSVESWSPGDAGWTVCEPLNVERLAHEAAVIGQTIYAFGGATPGGSLASIEAASVAGHGPPPPLPSWYVDLKLGAAALILASAPHIPHLASMTAHGVKLLPTPAVKAGAFLLGLEALGGGAHFILHEIAMDPPDPDYGVPVQPIFPTIPTPANDGSIPAGVYDAFVELQGVCRDIMSYEQAILAAAEKYAGAVEAGDYAWAQTHAEELAPWGTILSGLYAESAARKETLIDQLVAAGYLLDPIDDVDVANLRSSLLSSGLPQIERDILALYGYGADMEQELIDLHLSIDDDDIPRDLITALRGSAEIDRQLSTLLAIPEPMTILAVGLGIAGLGRYVRKRRRA